MIQEVGVDGIRELFTLLEAPSFGKLVRFGSTRAHASLCALYNQFDLFE